MYNISDIIFSVKIKDESQIIRFKNYLTQKTPLEVNISVKKTPFISPTKGTFIMQEDSLWFDTKSGHAIELYDDKKLVAQLQVNFNWTNAVIRYKKEIDYAGYTVCESLLSVLFRNVILHHCGLILHSSAMKYKGQGIVFSAPSGTGKTTHTTLWETHRGAEIINDDTPAIRMFGDETFVYGTPWSGSSQKYTNDKLPLKAIILLEQSPTNEIVQLKPAEAVVRLMPRVFLPYQDEALMKIAIDNVSQLIARVPIYLLKCRPDVEAMELVEKCLKL